MNSLTPTLTITDLTIGYCSRKKTYTVGKHLTASLYSGELTCLIGTNGCGKSTLLRTLSAFLPPLSGRVMMKGKDLKEYTRDELSRLIGVVLTDRVDVRDLRVYDLVAMGRMPYTGFWGSLSTSDHQLIEEAIELVGIRSLAQRPIHSLSDGELQKTLIAKTLSQGTPFIFLDEPTAFLDYPSKVELFLLLRRLARERQKTIFLSTHDLDLVLQMADRLWLLSQDQRLYTGIPEDLVAQGILNRFFPHPHLCFSSEQMAYQVRMPITEVRSLTIGVEGNDDVMRHLLCRALYRTGFRVTSRAEASVLVRISESTPRYVLTKKADTLLNTDLIEELLQGISAYISASE